MGAPRVTTAEAKRMLELAQEFGMTIRVCPREGSITFVPVEVGGVNPKESDEWTGKPFGT